MTFFRTFAAGTAAIALSACQDPAPVATVEERPNIVLILADDLGFNDIGLSGNPLVSTPNIDSLARDGARFARAYSGDAICAPSRAALLTGRYPQRFGFAANPLPTALAQQVLDAQAEGRSPPQDHGESLMLVDAPTQAAPLAQQGIPDSEETFAQSLQRAGYRTAIFGKWHLGFAPNLLPSARGFDESLIFPSGAALYADPSDPSIVNAELPWSSFDVAIWKRLKAQLYRDGVVEPLKAYMTYQLSDEASAFIRKNTGEPFAIYLSFNAVHNPLQAPKDVYDRMGHIPEHHLRTYYATVEALDIAIGRVLKTLDEEGLSKNTLVVFASDNGGAAYVRNPDANLPFRGWKTTYFEGGVRVPLFMRWPAGIPAGTVVRDTASLMDLAPTFRSLAGAAPPANPSDGIDLTPRLKGASSPAPERTLFFRNEEYRMVVKGDFKLQVSRYPERIWLHNLKADPAERMDLAAAMPDKVKELRALLAAHDGELVPPNWPVLARRRIAIDGDVTPAPPNQEIVYWALSQGE